MKHAHKLHAHFNSNNWFPSPWRDRLLSPINGIQLVIVAAIRHPQQRNPNKCQKQLMGGYCQWQPGILPTEWLSKSSSTPFSSTLNPSFVASNLLCSPFMIGVTTLLRFLLPYLTWGIRVSFFHLLLTARL